MANIKRFFKEIVYKRQYTKIKQGKDGRRIRYFKYVKKDLFTEDGLFKFVQKYGFIMWGGAFAFLMLLLILSLEFVGAGTIIQEDRANLAPDIKREDTKIAYHLPLKRESHVPVIKRHGYIKKVLLSGKSYVIFHKKYFPVSKVFHYENEGTISWYGNYKRDSDHLTATGHKFNSHLFAAAHKTLPFGTRVFVYNLENGKSIIVTVNDRGPYVKNRILDLTPIAAEALGFKDKGTTKAYIRVLQGNESIKSIN